MSDITASFSNSAPAALTQTAPTSTTPPVAPLVEPHSHAGLSPTEANTLAGWIKADLASGKMTQAQADKAFDDLGTPLDQRTTPVDLRSPEQVLLDQHFPAAKPEEYVIQWDALDNTPTTKEERQDRDQSTRAWLSGMEFPRDLGHSLITTIARVHEQTKDMTKGELEMYGYAEYAKLERAYGDTLDEKLHSVDRMVQAAEVKQPGLVRLLKSAGVMDTALVSSLLIGQAERWHARRKER